MASTPQYYATPRSAHANVSTANTGRDGTGTLATLLVGGSSGSQVDAVLVQALGTTTANAVRLFLTDNLSTTIMLTEINVPAQSPSVSNNIVAWGTTIDFAPFGLRVPTGWTLKASTNNAESYGLTAIGGDF